MSEVTTKKAEIGLHVQSLAELIKSDAKVSKADATGKIEVTVGDDLYARSLPEGITKEIVEQLQSHNAAFAAAGVLAAGDIGLKQLKKDKTATHVAMAIPTVGKDRFDFAFHRQATVSDGQGGQKEKFGTASAKFIMYGAGARGEMKKVKDHLADQALDVFGS